LKPGLVPALFLVLILVAVGSAAGVRLPFLFGVILPYAALVAFLGGVAYRVIVWAKTPVPFRIPTTCGQQKSLPWIKSSPLESPANAAGVVGRMALEVLFFRSLFRNEKTSFRAGRPVYDGAKWLWLAGLAFHWSFLIVGVRHLRFFFEPIPAWVNLVAGLDSLFEVGVPALFLTDGLLLVSVS